MKGLNKMGKLKLKLGSGSVVEKPLINAFLENGSTYVVLDNELNGSMGLPIILVSKLENDKLGKIVDQSEWQLVKEYLKNIIAGNKVEFVKLNNEVNADDLYYTQLTLPVPSFDALKNAYTFKEDDAAENPVASAINNPVDIPINISPEANPSVNVTPEPVTDKTIEITPVTSETPVVETAPVQAAGPTPEPVVEPTANPVVEPATPGIDVTVPVAEPAPATPEVNLDNPLLNNLTIPVEDTKVEEEIPNMGTEKEPVITPTPIIDADIPVSEPVKESAFKEQKEAFMQACENMFDALVQKFEKELENKNN